ncbi:dnaJ homolog subfamily C member 10-like [Trichogramma pretiosum]|uniref:dnaJ homolog subfamily C member 10-like n=1 Tax=Trichogramma pretiosum TaxID=7493 RepID=UPI0006C953A2|nr:dnaJ homolog subfamily C member 10-like [Trichogramma pretiosum]
MRFLRLAVFFVLLSLAWAAEDYYKLLGIERSADQREIRKAFKKLAVTEHPDKKTDDPDAHEKFIKLTTAYEVLKDPELRKKYDLWGEEGLDNNKRPQYQSYTYYQNNFGIYDDDPQIVTLSRTDYYDSVVDSDKMWFINFYSPQCSHCHTLAPVWRKIAKALEGVIRIGAVNCEDDWHLCNEIQIRSYPTLMWYPSKSKEHYGHKYNDAKDYEKLMKFVMSKVETKIKELNVEAWKNLQNGNETIKKPTLVLICRKDHYCFTWDERKRVASIFDTIVDVKVFNCKDDDCGSLLTDTTTNAVYLPAQTTSEFKPVLFEELYELEDLVKKVLDQLPEPKDISEEKFWEIKSQLEKKSNGGWLVCFYIGHATEFDVTLKKLPTLLKDVNLAKVNCGRYSSLCKNLNINYYPLWGVLKPGGAFETSHGKSNLNEVANFAKSSMKATNLWDLSKDQIDSIMSSGSNEPWFLDWYAPWCPPCMKFLPEFRRASLQFDPSVVRFGTIDCTKHSDTCRQYNIRSYPTAMLINGTTTTYFSANQRTWWYITEFIKETMNPTVIRLTSENFEKKLVKKLIRDIWVVDYFAPWCGPCRQLAPEWNKVAKALKELSFVKIASVDCEADRTLCREQAVDSYPTIRLYPKNSVGTKKVLEYSGSRDHVSMLNWITNFLPVEVREIEDWRLDQEVLQSDDAVLVDYYAPWCSHCISLEPQFAIAAQMLEDKVRFVKVNCDNYRFACRKAEIRGYPSLKLYAFEKDRKSLSAGLRLQGTTAAQIRDEVLNILPEKYLVEHDEL